MRAARYSFHRLATCSDGYMSQDVLYRPASATESGMQAEVDTVMGCQNVGRDFGHRAKRESRWSAGARIEWRMSIDESGAEKDPAMETSKSRTGLAEDLEI